MKSVTYSNSFLYPTNNFGRHNNVHYYFYRSYVNQGNNWNSYGLHQVEIRNESNGDIEILGWHMKDGRVQEDFKTNVIRPGLFYSARCVPNSWGTYKAVIGAVSVKDKSTGRIYTVAFEDPFHDYVNRGYKGTIIEGDDQIAAINNLKDHYPKEESWGSYDFKEFEGRGKTVFTIRGQQSGSTGRRY